MNKLYYYLTTLLLLFAWQVNAQVLNEAANWPNATWTLSGVYNAGNMIAEPTDGVSATFSFDDDIINDDDELFLESPVIDLTAANTAGESILTVSAAGYSYYQSGDDLLLEYYDVDAASWVLWDDFASNGTFSDYLSCNDGVLLSSELDISGFSATNLSGFKYRIHYYDDDGWKYGFCIQSPTITSTAPPTCFVPTALASANVTGNSADLSWTTGGATQWIVEYGEAGFTQGTGTVLTVNSGADTTLTSLDAQTEYDVYVRDFCAVGDSSAWSSSISFTTLCATYTPNYLEDFADYVPDCWSEATGAINASPTGTTSGWIQDDFGNVLANGKSVRIEIFSTGGDEWLISPTFDLSAGGFELNFDVALTPWNGTSSATINPDDTVYLMQSLDGGTTWTEITNWNNSTSISNTGDNITEDIATLTSATTKFAFVLIEGATSGGDFDFFMDNFQVRTPPTCQASTALTLSNVTGNSADLSWTSGGATQWLVEYGETGFTQGTGTMLTVNSGADTTLIGLDELTDYEVFVKDICAVGDSSTFTGASFSTPCATYTPNYLEDFADYVPDCWSEATGAINATPTGTTSSWVQDDFGNVFANGKSARIEIFSTGGDEWLISPTFDLSAGGFELNFDVALTPWNGTSSATINPDDTVYLMQSLDGGTTWTEITNWNNSTSISNTGDNITEDIATLTSATTKFAFVLIEGATSGGDFDFFMDNFQVRTPPTCPKSTNFAASLVSQTEVQLSWDVNSTASSFQIEYGFEDFVQGSTDGTYVTAGTNPFNISALQADTTYDFYVRDICGTGDSSLWVGPISVYTGYCLPNPSSVDGDGITNVTFGQTTIVNNATSVEPGNYGNYSTLVGDGAQSTNVDVEIEFSTGGVTYGTKIWVDWNNDLVFDETTEEVSSGTSTNNNPDTLVLGFTIPLSTPLGQYRMRIGGTDFGTLTPCYNGTWGSYEDYTLQVTAAPPCVTPSAITSNVLSHDSVELSWAAGSVETDWNIEYGEAGFTLGTGMVLNTSSNPDTLLNLMADTDYEFYIQSDCGADSSAWSTVQSFTTPVSCFAPTNLVVNEVGMDTVSISWTTGGASSSLVEYGIAGYTPGSGTILADTFVVLTGLTSGTVYDFYVRDFCGTADSSTWINTSFTTEANYCAGDLFTDLGGLTGDYSNSANDTYVICPDNPGDVVYVNFSAFSTENDFSGTGCYDGLTIYDGNSVAGTLITPSSLGVGSGNGIWCWDRGDATPNGSGDLQGQTLVSSDPSGCLTFVFSSDGSATREGWSAAVTCAPLSTCDFPTLLSNSDVSTDTVNLSWTTGGATEWIIEYGPAGYTAGSGTEILVDTSDYTLTGLNSSTTYDVFVRDYCGAGDSSIWIGPTSFTTIATCLEPINLNASNFGMDSATLSWESNGVATEWEIEYGVTGFTPTGLPTVTGVVDTFYNATGLNPGTDYDFYVRSRCSLTDSSIWSSVFTFTTLADYCAGDLFVDNGGLTGQYTADSRDTIVICGDNSEIISVTFNSFDTESNYDGLLIYDGPNTSSSLISSGATAGFNATTCPTGAWSGTAAFALTGANATQTSTHPSGCLTFVFGSDGSGQRDGWDANVTCNPRPAEDISVTQVSNFLNSCGNTNTLVEVEVNNVGNATQYNVPITVELTGDFNFTFNTTIDTIESLETITVVVDSFDTQIGGAGDIVAYSSLVGDVDLNNDTLSNTYNFNEVLSAPVMSNSNYTLCEGDSVNIDVVSSGNYVAWYDDMNATNLIYEGSSLNYNYNVDTIFYIKTVDTTVYTYTLELEEDFGDGWNGGSLSITADGNPVTGSPFSLGAGNTFDSFTFDVFVNQEIEVSYTVGGLFDYENIYRLFDNNGNVLIQDGDFTTAPVAGVTYSGSVDAGCYSELTMVEVVVNPAYNDTVVLSACDEFTYSLGTVTTSGFYTDSLLTSSGCDSVTTFNVTINNSVVNTQTINLCSNDTVVVGTNEYFVTGIYVDTLTTALGCDSIVTTDLSVNTPPVVTIGGLTPTVCVDAGVVNVNVSPLGGVLSGPGVSGNNFNPATAGLGLHTLTYTVVDANNCSASVSEDVDVIQCTGIKDISGIEAITIFPNPFTNTLNLTFNDAQSGELTINLFDVNGKVVVSKVVESNLGVNNFEVVVPEFAANGVHIIQIERGGNTYTKSLLKK